MHFQRVFFCLTLLAAAFFPVSAAAEAWPVESDLPPAPRAPSCYIYRAEPVYAAAERKIKVFVTHDIHGYVFEDASRGRIGLARLQGVVDAAKSEGYETYLMDAGDVFSGNAIAQFDSGLTVAELMGKMGYRVMAPGNHAFDYNASQSNPRYYSDVLLKTVYNFSKAPFDATSLNLSLTGDILPHVSNNPVTVAEGPDFRLIALGVLSPYSAGRSNPQNTAGFDFGLIGPKDDPDHAATKASLLERVRRALEPYDRPGDVVVVLSHLGNDDSEDYSRGQIRGSDLAAVPNVDFIVDSHSHNLIPAGKIGDAFYGIAGRYLENFAELTIIPEGDGLSLNMEIKNLEQVRHIPASTDMLAHLREASDRLGMGQQLFQVPVDYMGDGKIKEESTPLGRFLCRAMNAIGHTELALYNSGGIRSGLTPGWTTVGNLYDVIPFQNDLVTFRMPGRQILDFFADIPHRGTNAFPQFYGMSVYAWDNGPAATLGLAGVLDAEGMPLDPDRIYAVAINSFMAFGGDDYSFDTSDQARDVGDFVSALVLYLRNVAPDFESLRDNETLLVFPTREEAERAYTRALSRARDA